MMPVAAAASRAQTDTKREASAHLAATRSTAKVKASWRSKPEATCGSEGGGRATECASFRLLNSILASHRCVVECRHLLCRSCDGGLPRTPRTISNTPRRSRSSRRWVRPSMVVFWNLTMRTLERLLWRRSSRKVCVRAEYLPMFADPVRGPVELCGHSVGDHFVLAASLAFIAVRHGMPLLGRHGRCSCSCYNGTFLPVL